MSEDWGPPFGFAIRRNGSCLPEEETCVHTWNLTSTSETFYQCCPKPASCNAKYTGVCCANQTDCTRPISNPAHCANETWDLFRNDENDENSGYFCCEKGITGFIRKNEGVGCAKSADPTIPDTQWLVTESPGVAATSTSSSNTGAIAGGVVGGVAGLAIILALLWYFMRRRSQKQPPQEETPTTEASMMQFGPVQSSGKPSELDGQGYMAELENTPVHELPGNPRTR